MAEPRFVFAIVRVGSEALAKAEIAREHGELRLAFARPGLLTFKDPSGASDESFGADLVFARVAGLSLGLGSDVAELVDRLPPGPSLLHVFPRAVDDTNGQPGLDASRALETALLERAPEQLLVGRPPEPGERVVDVAVEPGEPCLVGVHRHAPGRWELPGGVVPHDRAAPPPSRSYWKLVEALAWARLELHAGETVLELGSAPGGMTMALLERGLGVTAVDPGELAPEVLAFEGPGGARATHLRVPVGALAPKGLGPFDWLVVDLNLAPPVTLRYVSRVIEVRRPRRGFILTLKLNDRRMFEQLPEQLARVRSWGADELRATQLVANRSEITVVGHFAPAKAPLRRARGAGRRRRR